MESESAKYPLGDYQAVNKESTAKGGFQFIEGSVEPALNRLEKRIGKQDWGEELRKHKDASKLTPQQQQLLFMGDLLEKKGSDEYMKKVMAGDKQGSMDAYYKLHHTAPDEATTNRAESIFGETYNPVEPKMDIELEKKQLNQVISDQVGMQLGNGFRGFSKTLEYMFGFMADSNDNRNKGGY
jgi:hypothetical protein